MTGPSRAALRGLRRDYGAGRPRVHAVRGRVVRGAAGRAGRARGPSGAGKTTLLNMVGGLDRPDVGQVWLGGREVTAASEADLLALRRATSASCSSRSGWCRSSPRPRTSSVPLRLAGVRAGRARGSGSRCCWSWSAWRRTPTSGRTSSPAASSSGSAMARALANEPQLLIADEPTGQLDSVNAEAMMSLIAALVHQRGVAALVSTHDPRMATYADRVLDLRDGRFDAT